MCLDKIAPVDVEENNIIELQPEILASLLKDRSTGKNIIWATDKAYLGVPGIWLCSHTDHL